MAIQAEFAHRPDFISQASALQLFCQLLGGVVGISYVLFNIHLMIKYSPNGFFFRISGTIFGNVLSSKLNSYNGQIPSEVISAVKQSVTVIFTLPKELQAPIVEAYIHALDYTFLYGVPAMGAALFFALFVRNWNLKERGNIGADAGAA